MIAISKKQASSGSILEKISEVIKLAPSHFKNVQRDATGYFCGYLVGKKVKEQTERFKTAREAIEALGQPK